jgi:NAD(P)-dependent dehydrogenase (short-subunit alcohol dehydrogenase family)
MHPDDSDAIQTEEKIWDLTMKVNCKGVWWGCKYAIQAMLQNPTDEAKGLKRGGSIINTASFVAKLGAATPQLACQSKNNTHMHVFSNGLSRLTVQAYLSLLIFWIQIRLVKEPCWL